MATKTKTKPKAELQVERVVVVPARCDALLAGEAAAGEYRSWRRTLMVSRNVLTLHFGALAYPLAKQLRGHRLPRELVNLWQEDADAITRLHVRGIITEDEASRARDRLAHAITDRMGGDWRELP